jgi:hypothetical protein
MHYDLVHIKDYTKVNRTSITSAEVAVISSSAVQNVDLKRFRFRLCHKEFTQMLFSYENQQKR